MNSLSARALALLMVDWRGSNGPAYLALADRVRLLVLDGRIPLGTRLPAERELAAQLELSRTTVSAAYADLRDSGYLESVRGSGSTARLPHEGGVDLDLFGDAPLDFSKASLPALPSVAQAAQAAVDRLPSFLSDSGFDPFGLLVLRRAIADRYSERGLPTDPEQIMITVGAQSAIHLLARTLLARGDRAIVESPGYPHAFDALKAAGARLVPVAVTTDEGWDVSGLEQAFQRTSPTVAYLMPEFQNPTGRTMDETTRARVLELAQREGTTLIVDETMTGLGLDGQARTAPFPVARNVVIIGSVGKSIWGGLRIGWVRAERELIQRMARARFASDLGTPILDQLVVAELVPDYEQILAGRRAYLRQGRDHLAKRIRQQLPGWRMPHVEGGIVAWVNIGAPLSSQLALQARNEGLVIGAGPRFGLDGVFERFLRIPFGMPADQLDRGVDALAAAWHAVTRSGVRLDDTDLAHVV
ncbi:MocR-like transcription factor YczR [Protaetiibacter mangrovi]|uniref:PLP-dependent aminotransferase family protein n=1 Tax=Protaetiibacter mangrovi TaxID=2970926 RepID=A0ABT1ZCL5_9MICO|nr:PLP-dependent aminotransferase family protein [Protaetiibacter mangrovi]MCS0498450.1 PLP-dependent aminotransferase family protein [Protaetiibacter mangrovi]TPW91673.1 PLP-dependent aminotransferase family protein [Schumannella luteola]